jgi:predicted murein hydrolase (TIGR00659 family)
MPEQASSTPCAISPIRVSARMTGTAPALRAIASSPLFGITLTIGAYQLGCLLQARLGSSPIVNPVLVAIVLVGALLIVAGVPYESYLGGAQFIHFLLGPATIALAVPLYTHFRHVRRSAVAICVAVSAGAVSAAVSAIGIAWALGATDAVVRSLAPKSVTTPIAIALSVQLGGMPDLTAVLVIMTGILGAIAATSLLDVVRIKCWRARGLATGVAAHGIGTARILAANELGGAFAGLGMGLCGILTSVFLPLIAWLVWR